MDKAEGVGLSEDEDKGDVWGTHCLLTVFVFYFLILCFI